MTRWEYQVFYECGNMIGDMENHLNRMGEGGWRLIDVCEGNMFIMERVKEDTEGY